MAIYSKESKNYVLHQGISIISTVISTKPNITTIYTSIAIAIAIAISSSTVILLIHSYYGEWYD